MDIPRPNDQHRKRIQRVLVGCGIGLLLAVTILGLNHLQPAAPQVPRASVWLDTVQEGQMLREVQGPGTLVPREIRWIAAQTDARVEHIDVRPGAAVEPDTVLVEMSNADLAQQTEEARYALQAAQAELTSTDLQLKSQQLDQKAVVGAARADYESARLQADAEKALVDTGVVPAIQYKRSELLAGQRNLRLEAESDRLSQFSASIAAQLAAGRARVAQARNIFDRRRAQIAALRVRAGFHGVLQQLDVQEGQRIAPGANIARVARPDELQAELHVPETQARDVQLNQKVMIDTHNGVVPGNVIRIDPAVHDGTVQVDVQLTGQPPPGARPDLSVDGTIEIERLDRVLFVGRPALGQPNTTIKLFKIVDNGKYAVQVPVEIGRASVNSVEIIKGLSPGEKVILSDTSEWAKFDRIRLD
jgi:HlyD family secretion protein